MSTLQAVLLQRDRYISRRVATAAEGAVQLAHLHAVQQKKRFADAEGVRTLQESTNVMKLPNVAAAALFLALLAVAEPSAATFIEAVSLPRCSTDSSQ